MKEKHPECLGCGKELKPHLSSVNFITNEWDKHSFTCDCLEENIIISIG